MFPGIVTRRAALPVLICCATILLASLTSAADFEEELTQASQTLVSIQGELEKKVNEGQLADANKQLLNMFPQNKRTPAQTLAVANMLYGFDPKLSYAMHKEVAEKLPDEPLAALEWAMEQHRAGEYAGALTAYDKYSKANPEFAPVHGLAADCLIRLGKTREALDRWQISETARQGSLQTLESLICDIYRDTSPEPRRLAFREKAAAGDIDAAVRLIALDAKFERDWWNNGPSRGHLVHDVPLLQKLPPHPRIQAALCVAECIKTEEPTRQQIQDTLSKYGFLIDPKKTLPVDADLLSLMLAAAEEAGILTVEQARQQFGDLLRERARNSKDASLWNVVAHLYIDTPQMLAIEEQAWKATGDSRFAAGYLVERLKQKTLKAEEPLLAEAVKQFPESSQIMAIAIAVTTPPSEELIVRCIKSEYRHLSGAGLVGRPSAKTLRGYFAALRSVLEKKK